MPRTAHRMNRLFRQLTPLGWTFLLAAAAAIATFASSWIKGLVV